MPYVAYKWRRPFCAYAAFINEAPDLRVRVKERSPTSAREAAELLEHFLVARRGPKTFRYEPQQKSSGVQGKSVGSGAGGGPGPMAGSAKPLEKNVAPSRPRVSAKPLICFFCGQEGHIKPECPSRKAKSAYCCALPRPGYEEVQGEGKRQMAEVTLTASQLKHFRIQGVSKRRYTHQCYGISASYRAQGWMFHVCMEITGCIQLQQCIWRWQAKRTC